MDDGNDCTGREEGTEMSSFEHYFIERNGLWSEHLQAVKESGFDDASPLARLIYSCEIGDIDQHASEDLKAVSATIATLQAELAFFHGAFRSASKNYADMIKRQKA